MTAEVLAESTRTDVRSGDEVVESIHHGHVVVTRGDQVVASLGDAGRATFIRSAAKPFQAAACLELLTTHVGALSGPLLAVSWASHRGEPAHLDAVRELCALAGIAPADLTCPADRPQDDPTADPARIHHNCSGKHALFALAGRHLGLDRDELLEPEARLQAAVLARLASDLGPAVAVGIDGCGAPAVAVPLSRLAVAYAQASVAGGSLGAVVEAGFDHPNLVGGRGRIESVLLGHGVVAKVGADGVYGAGREGVGVAVKVDGGNLDAAGVALQAVATHLGWFPGDAWQAEPVRGGGAPTGRVRPSVPLRDLTAMLDSLTG